MNAKLLIQTLTHQQIVDFLKVKYQLFPCSVKEKEIYYPTAICHGGDSKKLVFFKDSKTFYCFTNCGAMSLFDLISKLESCGFSKAFHIVCNFFGIEREKKEQINPEYEDDVDEYTPMGIPKRVLPVKKCLLLNKDDWYEKKYYAGWIKEGISISVMRDYNIRWYGAYNHIIIPHYNENNELIGIRRRALNPEEIKYMPILGYEHHLGHNLYGIHKFPRNQGAASKYCYIVESEKSVLQAASFLENNNVLATCGFNVSSIQLYLLTKLGIYNVCLAFDNDINWSNPNHKDFKLYTRKMLNIANKISGLGIEVEIMGDWQGNLLDEKDSPFDKGREVFYALNEKKISLSRFTRMCESPLVAMSMPDKIHMPLFYDSNVEGADEIPL